MPRSILITGGAGFIGSHLVRRMVQRYPQYQVVNVDALTYAGHLENLADIAESPNYQFHQVDICHFEEIRRIMQEYHIDTVIHLAAESHVDRSIADPFRFAQVNVMGTLSMLEAARQAWNSKCSGKIFYQVSTDEVYGALEDEGFFTEKTPYDPRSPYSASKASADHFVRSYGNTYSMPYLISCCSNNYGPFQHPEKLIPLSIHRIINQLPIPIYGQGLNVRDWLYVEDHAMAIDTILHHGKPGNTYNVGGHNERSNITLVRTLCRIVDKTLKRKEGDSEKLITFVPDRLGHDFRYAIDSAKLMNEVGWRPVVPLEIGLEQTVNWYLQNQAWMHLVMDTEK